METEEVGNLKFLSMNSKKTHLSPKKLHIIFFSNARDQSM